jgi:Myb-like DNA-binding domain
MCQNRYYRSLDPLLKQGSWDAQEDDKLRRAVAAYGNSWMDIASFIPGRSNDQCRDRWTDYADPSLVRGEWTEEEDSKLLQEVETLGPKWKEISMRIGNGRSDTMVRNL